MANYTTLAQRFTARYPKLTFLLIQSSFWIYANILLTVITSLHATLLGHIYHLPLQEAVVNTMVVGILFGIFYGVTLGTITYYMDRKVSTRQPLGLVILLKAAAALVILFVTLLLFRYMILDLQVIPVLPLGVTSLDTSAWRALTTLLLIYYFVMSLLLNFINQMNSRYGPGVLIPLLLGRYRSPKEESRIFMFMDLRSSTMVAERLGHLHYSSFIRDCFSDINQVLHAYNAQVYQYVGDEIVITWQEREGIKDHLCIKFYFACMRALRVRDAYYLATYGFQPDFKAGMHLGVVTAVEIGEIKRDIAYHGDTLNTASRIQGMCNQYNKPLLISRALLDKLTLHRDMQSENMGEIILKGKAETTEIYSITWAE
ncbi:MAG TPA: adenylate/guanylate cyclase domain-containing protein [Ohtaekwangia sp.]|uniref:adenylate/guanylate cyclase domain-containing protein n=1 Tax=Ohtaekwangia sp. TaxID=2066019 RepID=UPI002F9278C4